MRPGGRRFRSTVSVDAASIREYRAEIYAKVQGPQAFRLHRKQTVITDSLYPPFGVEHEMTNAGIFRRGWMAISLMTVLSSLPMPCSAELADNDKDFAALQAETRKTFRDRVTPFVKNYCADCHGDKKMKGGITFSPAIKNPGTSASGKKWKQALANVKAHDMPPDDVDKQPSDEEPAPQ